MVGVFLFAEGTVVELLVSGLVFTGRLLLALRTWLITVKFRASFIPTLSTATATAAALTTLGLDQDCCCACRRE